MKKAALLTISTFFVFISFVALLSAVHVQSSNTHNEMKSVAAFDSVLYEFDSIEHSLSRLLTCTWDVDIWDLNDETNVDIWTEMPHAADITKAERFAEFAEQNSRNEITATLDVSKLRMDPQDTTIEATTNRLTTTPKNTNSSLGQIIGYRIDIYWDGGSEPITSADFPDQNGIDIEVNLHSEQGQKLRTYHKKLSPYSRSLIFLHLSTGNTTPKSSKTINVSITSPGKLEIISEQGTSFEMLERIILEGQETRLEFENAYISVNNTIFGAWKEGEVKI